MSAPAATVLILSDTHGAMDPRIAALSASCDYAVHAGDVGAAAVLQALAPRVGIVAVRGNNDVPDKWPAGEAAVLDSLGHEGRLDLPGGMLVVVHGDTMLPAAARHARLRARYPDARCIAYGHTHRLVCDVASDPWVLNPGAAGRARTFGGPSCILLRTNPGGWSCEPVRFEAASPRRIRS